MPVLFSYLELVDLTGRAIHPKKRGIINNNLPDILERLNINASQWLELTTKFETCFRHAAGSSAYLEQYAKNQKQQRIHGKQNALRLIG